jgi:hypothetical protein
MCRDEPRARTNISSQFTDYSLCVGMNLRAFYIVTVKPSDVFLYVGMNLNSVSIIVYLT